MANIVVGDITPRIQYTATSGQTVFAYAFPIFADADLKVYIGSTLKTLTAHYTVSGAATSSGGNVTLVTGATTGDIVTIYRDLPISRTSDYQTAGDLLATTLNDDLDILVMCAQQNEQSLARGLLVNQFDDYGDLTLPDKASRVGKVLAFNATSGDPEGGPTIGDVSSIAAITADISTLADIEDGTDATDAIQTVAGISANVTTVAGVSSDVSTVANATYKAQVETVADDLNESVSEINTVAVSIANVDLTGGSIANVNTVGSAIANVNLTGGSIASVNTVGAAIANVNTTAGSIANVNTVADDLNESTSEIDTVAGAIANVNTVGSAIANVNTTAGSITNVNLAGGSIANVNTVATNIANVNTVATNISDVVTVANDLTEAISEIETAADDLNEATSEIDTVATNIANVNTVGGAITNVNTVATNIANVNLAGGSIANVNLAGGSIANVNTVAGQTTEIGRLGTADAVADMNLLGVTGVIEDMNLLGVTGVIEDMGILGTASNVTVMGNLGTSANVANMSTCASNLTEINAFASTYRIASSAPTTSLNEGDLYFDTTLDTLKVYDGNGWINAGSSVNGTSRRQSFTATSGQTSFTITGGYDPDYIDVFLDGVKLNSTDFTDTSGSAIVLAAGATTGQLVDVIGYGTFELADHYNKVASDARYLTSVGANSVGASELNVSGNGTSGQYLGSDGDGTMTWTSISADPTMGGDISGTASNAQIVANAVTANEIVNGAVTEAKLASGVGFASGVVMIFRQTSAPTGWTKSTTHNDKALRVVSGSISAGGTHDLSSPPSTAHTHTGPSHTHTSAAHGHGMSGSIGQTTLTIAQMPNHSHDTDYYGGSNSGSNKPRSGVTQQGANGFSSGNTGGGVSHNHGHGLSVSSNTPGATGASGTGATGSTAPTAFSPKFIDVIVATKD